MKNISIITSFLVIAASTVLAQNQAAKWFPQYDFEAATFNTPPQYFSPMARWW